MTASIPVLVEVKFACPNCGQHIECDSAYCGTRIDCPTCHGLMIVPRLSSFTETSSDSSPSGDAKTGVAGSDSALESWTDEAWTRRVEEERASRTLRPEASIALQSWFWFFLIGPLLVFFYGGGFRSRGLSPEVLIPLFLLCAVVSGFLLAKMASSSLPGFVASGVLFSVGILVVDVLVCVFGGCAMECTQAVGAR